MTGLVPAPAVAARRPFGRLGVSRMGASRVGATIAGALLIGLAAAAILAPWLSSADPLALDPSQRLRPPGGEHWLGTDQYGRDVWSRVVHGARVSLAVGGAVSVCAVATGLLIGLVAGYIRWLDAVIMRVMDGLMAIPGVLLAIAMVSLSGASLRTVIIAITIPEIPRVVRLVRAVTLSLREQPYVEAAITLGSSSAQILWRHILPNSLPPLTVQATYIAASAMLTESILSFIGAGTPPEFPSWGNMMAEGRLLFSLAPGVVLFPGAALAATILLVNVLGDALRDRLDPHVAKRV